MSAAETRTRWPGIYKRGNSYTFRVTDKRTGRSYRGTASTQAEAKQLLAKKKVELEERGSLERSTITFEMYALGKPAKDGMPAVPGWLDLFQGRTRKRIRPETMADYRKVIERHAVPFFGRRRMVEIEVRDVKAYIAQMEKRTTGSKNKRRPVSANTVRLAVAPVKALFATALEEGVIRSNPCTGARVTHAERVAEEGEEHVKALTEDELRRVLAAIPAEQRLVFEFLAQTGLRVGELRALQWGDVDLGKRRVQIRRRFYRGTFAPPKSRYGVRSIPISERMAQALGAVWSDRVKTGRAPAGTDPVFATWVPVRPWLEEPAGWRMLDRGNLYARVLKPAAAAADVPWCGFHTFRHTCATVLFRNGLNAKQVQVWLGHHSPAFTMATYVHLLSDDLEAPDFLDRMTGWEADGSQTTRDEAPDVEPESGVKALG
jgi:integrase